VTVVVCVERAAVVGVCTARACGLCGRAEINRDSPTRLNIGRKIDTEREPKAAVANEAVRAVSAERDGNANSTRFEVNRTYGNAGTV